MPARTLRVLPVRLMIPAPCHQTTQSVVGCIPTQSVGTINKRVCTMTIGGVTPDAFPAKAGPTKSTAFTLWDRLQPGSL
jgi:hypothetical protein